MKMTVFWDVAACSLVDIDRHLGGTSACIIRVMSDRGSKFF
jgi:hypothetical protein